MSEKAKLVIASDKYFTMMVFDGKNKLNFGEVQAQQDFVNSIKTCVSYTIMNIITNIRSCN